MGFVLEAACLCNTGRIRRNNEDNFYFDGRCLPADNNGLDSPLTMTAELDHTVHLAVFDGMGGENFGELASFGAADRMRVLLAEGEPVPAERGAVAEMAQELNRAVVKKGKDLLTERMGSTMVSFCFSAQAVLTCNLGDSRAYALRGGEFTQLSEDHVDTRPGVKKAPLTQHLGIDPENFLLEPTVTERALRDGDRYLLCSDGLTDMLSDSEIAAILSGTATARECAEKLVAAALKRGGRDNITVIVCRVCSDGKTEQVGAAAETEKKAFAIGSLPAFAAWKRYWPILAGALGLLLLLVLGYTVGFTNGLFAGRQETVGNIERIEPISATLAAGAAHTVGLRSDGSVVALGWNDYGQCNVDGWRDIVAVAPGGFHTVGLQSDGSVVAVGYNGSGRCEVSGWTDIVAIAAGGYHTVGLRSDGSVVATGLNTSGQCDVSDWRDIVAIAAGGYHTVGLKRDGTVVSVGANGYGQCDVSGWRDIVAIAAGEHHTIGLKRDGTVVAVGNNRYGQCDVSDWRDIVAVAAGDIHTVGLRSDGTVVAVGDNEYRQCNVGGWRDIVAIAAGGDHTLGLRSDGTVVAVGYNEYGECNVSSWKNIRVS